jgi:hypothetical protein
MTQAAYVGVLLVWISANAANTNETFASLHNKEALARASEASPAARPFIL